jgi:hypothetical protein
VLLFCVKAFSLLSPCQPFAADPWATYPLLAVASIDFFSVGVGFSVRGRHMQLDGLLASAVLLAVHVAVISILIRRDALCVRTRIAWDE